MKMQRLFRASFSRRAAGFGLLFAVCFVAVHALGWRENTTIISATLPNAQATWEGTGSRAAMYLGAYFGALIVTPVCLLGALLNWGWERQRARRPILKG